jgi:hypothetical protein
MNLKIMLRDVWPEKKFINTSVVETNSPSIAPAPSVRHIRSPWSLRSGGHGLRASMKYGSAVGAIYP